MSQSVFQPSLLDSFNGGLSSLLGTASEGVDIYNKLKNNGVSDDAKIYQPPPEVVVTPQASKTDKNFLYAAIGAGVLLFGSILFLGFKK